MKYQSDYYLVDIDGTLTNYRNRNVELLHGNFLFPVIRDLMVENGWRREHAIEAIYQLAEEVIFWDYPDFIAEFKLPVEKSFRQMRQWHLENIIAYEKTVQLIKRLAAEGKNLFIMSNNPYMGCLFKLQAAGLADNDFHSPYFKRIFGTNILRGCKHDQQVWQRALALIPALPSQIGVIGDNPKEDGEIPRSCGISDIIIIPQTQMVCGIENLKKDIQ